MGSRNRTGRLIGILSLVTASVLALEADAGADPAGHFLDTQPLVVDLTTSPSAIKVHVVNVSATSVQLTVSVTGQASDYLTVEAPTQRVPSGVGTFVLQLRGEPLPSQGTLVLSGTDGTLDRQPVKLVGMVPQPVAGSLVPGSFDSLSIPATSLVPSFVNEPWSWVKIGWVALSAAIALLIFALLFVASRKSHPRFAALFAGIGVVALVTAAFVFAGALASGVAVCIRPDDKCLNRDRVAAVTETVDPPAGGSVTATMSGDNGEAGAAMIDGKELTISGLGPAGTYSGSIDTQPAIDGGEIKISVKVRDWWPYAFLTIAVGVLIGQIASLYFPKILKTGQLEARRADIQRRVNLEDSEWQIETVGTAWGGAYCLADFVKSQLEQANIGESSHQAAAEAKLTAVDTFAAGFNSMRSRVNGIGQRSMQLFEQFNAVADEISVPEPGWLKELTREMILDGQDAKKTKVVDERDALATAAQSALAAATTRVARLSELSVQLDQLGSVNTHELFKNWKRLAGDVLRASNAKDVESLDPRLDQLAQSIGAAKARGDEAEDPYIEPVSRTGVTIPSLRRMAAGHAGLQGWLQTHDIAAPSTRAEMDRDELADISVPAGDAHTNDVLQWRFSDESRSERFPVVTVPDEGKFEVQHVFAGTSRDVSATLVAVGPPEREIGTWRDRISQTGAAARIRNALTSDTSAVLLLAFTLAVGSGMVALYFPNSTWGASGAYIIALLWGTATFEAVKAAAKIIEQIWPTD
jgi:hypothetical protein